MQDRKQENILLDFPKTKALMLEAAKKYLGSEYKNHGGDRFGQYHGKSGINRAKNLIKCLMLISDDNKLAILAMLLAIFGHPSAGLLGISIGRSSALASMIADAFITGDSEHGSMIHIETLASEIFSNSSLQKVKNNYDAKRLVPNDMASFLYLDKTIAVRYLLQDILNSQEFIKDKKIIESVVKKLNPVLTRSTFQINLDIFKELKDQFNNYKSAVTVAFMEMTNPPLPPELGENISKFFTLKDSEKMARTNKATRDAAKENAPIKRNLSA